VAARVKSLAGEVNAGQARDVQIGRNEGPMPRLIEIEGWPQPGSA
jgi:hypothetical protein